MSKHRITLPDNTPDRISAATFQRLSGGTPLPVDTTDMAPPKKSAGIRLPKLRKMNQGEAEYERILRAEFPDCTVMFEAMTFHLPGGSRYKVDFTVWRRNTLVLCVEVKGSRRLGSAGRSHTVLKEAIAAFPAIPFRYAKKDGEGWAVTNANVPGPSSP